MESKGCQQEPGGKQYLVGICENGTEAEYSGEYGH